MEAKVKKYQANRWLELEECEWDAGSGGGEGEGTYRAG